MELLARLIVVSSLSAACGPAGGAGDFDPEQSCAGGVHIRDGDGAPTGLVECPDGRVNRARAGECEGGACSSDSDCPSGQACVCSGIVPGHIPGEWPRSGGAVCVSAGCRSDGDCSSSGECGLSGLTTGPCGAADAPALSCRDQITCHVDDECVHESGYPASCAIDDPSGEWRCNTDGCPPHPNP